MLIKIGVLLILAGAFTLALVQIRKSDGGPDTRPRYYKSRDVSLWPFEMKNTARHAHGRVWVGIYPNGSATQFGDGKREIQETIDVVLWSQVPIASIRLFDETTGHLLLAKDGDEVLTCHPSAKTSTFPKRYVICGINMPPMETVLYLKITDENINEFVYRKSLSSMATEIKRSHDWITNP